MKSPESNSPILEDLNLLCIKYDFFKSFSMRILGRFLSVCVSFMRVFHRLRPFYANKGSERIRNVKESLKFRNSERSVFIYSIYLLCEQKLFSQGYVSWYSRIRMQSWISTKVSPIQAWRSSTNILWYQHSTNIQRYIISKILVDISISSQKTT